MKNYNNFQLGMRGVQGLAVALLCYLLGPGLSQMSNDPVLIVRIFWLLGVLAGAGGVSLILIAMFRKS